MNYTQNTFVSKDIYFYYSLKIVFLFLAGQNFIKMHSDPLPKITLFCLTIYLNTLEALLSEIPKILILSRNFLIS